MNLLDFEYDKPLCLVSVSDGDLSKNLAALLEVGGWRYLSNLDLKSTIPDLVIFDGGKFELDIGGFQGFLPLIMLASPGMKITTSGDEIVCKDCSNAEMMMRIDRWRPTPDALRFAEVARGFDEAAVRPIAQGLSIQLEQAIAGLDAGNFATAHRIAGLAGTLGFRRASKAWLAIDEGDLSDIAAARREARLATVAIAHWLAVTGSAPDTAA